MTDRNSQTLWNVVYRRGLFWDGRAATLEEQALEPIDEEVELGRVALLRNDDVLDDHEPARRVAADVVPRSEAVRAGVQVRELERAVGARVRERGVPDHDRVARDVRVRQHQLLAAGGRAAHEPHLPAQAAFRHVEVVALPRLVRQHDVEARLLGLALPHAERVQPRLAERHLVAALLVRPGDLARHRHLFVRLVDVHEQPRRRLAPASHRAVDGDAVRAGLSEYDPHVSVLGHLDRDLEALCESIGPVVGVRAVQADQVRAPREPLEAEATLLVDRRGLHRERARDAEQDARLLPGPAVGVDAAEDAPAAGQQHHVVLLRRARNDAHVWIGRRTVAGGRDVEDVLAGRERQREARRRRRDRDRGRLAHSIPLGPERQLRDVHRVAVVVLEEQRHTWGRCEHEVDRCSGGHRSSGNPLLRVPGLGRSLRRALTPEGFCDRYQPRRGTALPWLDRSVCAQHAVRRAPERRARHALCVGGVLAEPRLLLVQRLAFPRRPFDADLALDRSSVPRAQCHRRAHPLGGTLETQLACREPVEQTLRAGPTGAYGSVVVGRNLHEVDAHRRDETVDPPRCVTVHRVLVPGLEKERQLDVTLDRDVHVRHRLSGAVGDPPLNTAATHERNLDRPG
ncbi:MAG: cytochrome c peroxidase [Planctomycetota bacterium]